MIKEFLFPETEIHTLTEGLSKPETAEQTEKENSEQLNQEFQRIVTSIRSGEIRGETIALPLRTDSERIKLIGDNYFLLCRVVNCSFTTKQNYCYTVIIVVIVNS